jgi:hypothetical protein
VRGLLGGRKLGPSKVLVDLHKFGMIVVGRQVEMTIPICQSRKSSICENLAEYLSADIQDI